jgi:serine/threonine-protein kinase
MPHAIEPPDPPDIDDTPGPDRGGGGRKKRWLIAVAAAVLLITCAVGLVLRPDDPPPEDTTPVPVLVGLTRAGAEAALREKGLTPSVVTASPGPACTTAGAVIAQNPSAGQPAGRGTQISITVCGASSPVTTTPKTTDTTPAVKRVAVPGIGSTRESAEAALRAVGLFARFEDRNSAKPKGQVIGSDPRRGVRVRDGSTIIVFVSRGNLCQVPDVTGETGEIAKSLLSEARLESLTREVSSDKPVGTVVRQSEAGDEEVECGAIVTLSVSTGPEPTTTPPTTPPAGTGG